MARFCGKVGYVVNNESDAHPGVWGSLQEPVERTYYGDVNRTIRRLEPGEGINDNVVINNEISIVADPFAREHFFAIRYVKWMGVAWKVSNVEVLYPRLVLTLGGRYNGRTAN